MNKRKRKSAVFRLHYLWIALATLQVGCGFRGVDEPKEIITTEKSQSDNASEKNYIYMDWDSEENTKKPEVIKYKMPLEKNKDGSFSSKRTFTLPAKPPSSLRFSFSGEDLKQLGNIDFSRSTIKTNGEHVVMTPNCSTVESGAVCVLSGLGNAIKADEHSFGEIDLQLFEARREIVRFKVSWQTPPSDVKVTSSSEFSTALHPTEFVSGGKKYLKVRELVIATDHSRDIDLVFPRTFSFTVFRAGLERTYTDFGPNKAPQWRVSQSAVLESINGNGFYFRDLEFPQDVIERNLGDFHNGFLLSLNVERQIKVSEYVLVGDSGISESIGINIRDKKFVGEKFSRVTINTDYKPVYYSHDDALGICPPKKEPGGGRGGWKLSEALGENHDECVRRVTSTIKNYQRSQIETEIGRKIDKIHYHSSAGEMSVGFHIQNSGDYEELRKLILANPAVEGLGE